VKNELTPAAAAEVLGVSADSVRRMVDRGELLARRSPGGQRRIPREVVEAMKLRLENPGDPLGATLRGGLEDAGADSEAVELAGSAAPGATARPARRAGVSTEVSGLTLEQARQVALEAVSVETRDAGYGTRTDAGLIDPQMFDCEELEDFRWTALGAEQARRFMLQWFEENHRDGWTRREVEDVATELVLSWAKEHPRGGVS
jgi:excisionase family DNA binding protein